MTRFYREAERLRIEKRNQELWLQGLYIYEAIGRLAPILHAFPKRGTKAEPYMKAPYPLTETDKEEQEKQKEEKIKTKFTAKIEGFSHLPKEGEDIGNRKN